MRWGYSVTKLEAHSTELLASYLNIRLISAIVQLDKI